MFRFKQVNFVNGVVNVFNIDYDLVGPALQAVKHNFVIVHNFYLNVKIILTACFKFWTNVCLIHLFLYTYSLTKMKIIHEFLTIDMSVTVKQTDLIVYKFGNEVISVLWVSA